MEKNAFFDFMHHWFLRKNEKRNLKIVGSSSLKFPSSDIASVEWGKRDVVLTLNEMSLFGSDSPFDDEFLREIRCERENSLPLREFLNIFQHRLAILRFEALTFANPKILQELGELKWQNRFSFYEEKPSLEFFRKYYANKFPNAKILIKSFALSKIKNPSPVILGKTALNYSAVLGEFCKTLTNCVSAYLEQILPLNADCHFGAKLSRNFFIGEKYEHQ